MRCILAVIHKYIILTHVIFCILWVTFPHFNGSLCIGYYIYPPPIPPSISKLYVSPMANSDGSLPLPSGSDDWAWVRGVVYLPFCPDCHRNSAGITELSLRVPPLGNGCASLPPVLPTVLIVYPLRHLWGGKGRRLLPPHIPTPAASLLTRHMWVVLHMSPLMPLLWPHWHSGH